MFSLAIERYVYVVAMPAMNDDSDNDFMFIAQFIVAQYCLWWLLFIYSK